MPPPVEGGDRSGCVHMGPCGEEDHRVIGPVFGVVAATRFRWEAGSWRPNRRLVPTATQRMYCLNLLVSPMKTNCTAGK